jgi:hypothetical protein
LYLQAPRTQYASEFGHLIRIVSIYAHVESMMDCKHSESETWITDSEKAADSWMSSLPDHLRFSEDNLQMQMSMFETSSNAGAWSFCCMHVIHASCMLALGTAKQRGKGELTALPHWPVDRLELIMTSLGSRARNSLILGSVLWSLIKYCRRNDLQICEWSADHEERWGIRVEDFVSLERRQPASALPLQQTQQTQPSLEQQGDPAPVRPPHERRLSNREQQSDLRSSEPRSSASRSVNDTDIDPALQIGLGPRNQVTGDTPPSLPSLKSSGLLDSWSVLNDSPSAPGQISWNTTSHSRLEAQPPPRTNAPHQLDSESSRPVSSGMPVGMAWLANEPTTSR